MHDETPKSAWNTPTPGRTIVGRRGEGSSRQPHSKYSNKAERLTTMDAYRMYVVNTNTMTVLLYKLSVRLNKGTKEQKRTLPVCTFRLHARIVYKAVRSLAIYFCSYSSLLYAAWNISRAAYICLSTYTSAGTHTSLHFHASRCPPA